MICLNKAISTVFYSRFISTKHISFKHLVSVKTGKMYLSTQLINTLQNKMSELLSLYLHSQYFREKGTDLDLENV